MHLSISDIQQIMKIFCESDLQRLHLEIGDIKLAVSKAGAESVSTVPWTTPPSVQAAASATSAPPAEPELSASTGPADTTKLVVAGSENGLADTASVEGLYELKAPMLGVFYRRPSPDQPPFVEVGSEVEETDPVCIIDVMKLFNRINAGCAGRIVKILVEDGQMVEYGQTLMLIEPRKRNQER